MSIYDYYISGYYGMKNTGDDALMTASLWGALTFLNCRKNTLSSFSDVTVNSTLFPKRLSDPQRFKGQNRLTNYWAAIRSNSILFGGGSTLHSLKDIDQKLHMMKLTSNNNHLALGVGLGPFQNSAAEKKCAELLDRCQFVGVRDTESLSLAKSIAPDANIKLTFDLAPSLLKSDRIIKTKSQGIGLNLCPAERLKGNTDVEKRRVSIIAKELFHVLKNTHETIYLIDFNGHSSLGDNEIHRELINEFYRQYGQYKSFKNRLIHIRYQSNPYRVIRMIASLKCMISMRLHGCVFGYMTNTPVIGLAYHSKCLGWKEQIGMADNHYFDLQQEDSLNLLSHTVLTAIYGKHSAPRLPIASAVHSSLDNWRYAHEYITKESTNSAYFLECGHTTL